MGRRKRKGDEGESNRARQSGGEAPFFADLFRVIPSRSGRGDSDGTDVVGVLDIMERNNRSM